MELSKVKIIILIFALLLHSVFFVSPANAGMWGESMLSVSWKQIMEEIMAALKAALLAEAKQMAVEEIDKLVGNLIGGSGSGDAKFITNWQEYLYQKPAEKTKLYMNDWFDSIGGGKSSSSNYSSASSSGDYAGQLIKQTKDSLLNSQPPTMNIQEYAKDPTQPFAEGNWRAFNALISNPANNAFGLALSAQQAFLSKLEQEQKKAEAQAIAYQGYLATTSGGGSSTSSSSTKEPTVTMPGSTTASIEAGVQDLPNKIIANAQSIPEVIVSVVTKIVTKAIKQGIGKAKQNAQRQDSSSGSSSSGFGSFGPFGQ